MVLYEPGIHRFQSTDEHRFFQEYVTKTAGHLSGFYKPSLWNQIVLQASEAEESIRHAVISIGALNMTSVSTPKGTEMKASKELDDHHVFALHQYSKAINALRQKVFSTEYDLRLALVASLLIVCFETYHGNYESANRHTKTAVRLIETRPTSTSTDVEPELLRAFDRLDIQTITEKDPYTLSEHLNLLNCNGEILATMPEVFDDVLEARAYYACVGRQAAHFISAFWAVHTAPTGAVRGKPSLICYDTELPCTSAEILALHAEKLGLLERWMMSFRPVFESGRKKKGTNEFLAVTGMRTLFLIGWIRMKTLGAQSEMIYDQFLPVFSELVDLCHAILYPVPEKDTYRQGESSGDEDGETFVVDMQTVMILDYVGKKCRVPWVRRKAIMLLRTRPRREAFWDSLVAASVCEWVTGIEEEGMVDGIVKEEQRARGIGIYKGLEDEARSVEVSCTLGNGETRRGTVYW